MCLSQSIMSHFQKPFRFVFCLFCLCGFTGNSFAQKGFSFGIKAGANFSQLLTTSLKTPRLTASGSPVVSGGQVVYDFYQDNKSQATGFVGGVYARFGKRIFLQPEVLVSTKGGSVDLVQTGGTTQKLDVKFTTFDIPLLIGLKLGPLRLNAGPMASLVISENSTLKDSFKQYTTQSISKTAQDAVFGYQAGAGLSLLGLQLDVRYEGNFSDFSSVGLKTPSGDARFNSKTSLWQITAGYGF